MEHNQSENGRDKTSTGESEIPIRRSTEDPVHHTIGVTEASSEIGTHDITIKESGKNETIVTGQKNRGTNGTLKITSHGRATGPTGFAATTAGGQGRFLHNKSDGSSISGGRRNTKALKEKTKEKKSMMNRMKDKLSCRNGGAVDVVCSTLHKPPPVDTISHEKKGNMDEIKEQLPGHHEIDR